VSDVTERIEIGRPAAEVFAYLDDLRNQPEWQTGVLSVRVEDGDPTRVGTRVVEERRVGGGTRTVRYEVTEHVPGRGFAFRGGGGPLEVAAAITVEPMGDDRCAVTAEFRFGASGTARLMLPMVRREAQRQVPQDQARLRDVLEGRAGA
jgi:uncharacterized membrane protein